MKKSILKICSYLLLILFVFESCVREPVTNIVEAQSTKIFQKDIDYKNISSVVLQGVNKLSALRQKGEIPNEESLYKFYIQDQTLRDTIGKSCIRELSLYQNIGFDAFMEAKAQERLISKNQAKTIIDIKQGLSSITKSPDVSIEKVYQFLDSEIGSINSNENLTTNEKKLPLLCCYLIKQMAQNTYETYRGDMSKLLRGGCDFWDGLLCVALSIAVGVVVAVALAFFISLVPSSAEWFANGTPVSQDDAGLIVGVILGFLAGVSFYDTCCNWFNPTVKVPSCGCPSPMTPVCASGYFFDGCNCARNETPPQGTHPFHWNNGVYYTALSGNVCPAPAQFYDGANCYVGHIGGWEPFVWNNFWYTKPKCK